MNLMPACNSAGTFLQQLAFDDAGVPGSGVARGLAQIRMEGRYRTLQLASNVARQYLQHNIITMTLAICTPSGCPAFFTSRKRGLNMRKKTFVQQLKENNRSPEQSMDLRRNAQSLIRQTDAMFGPILSPRFVFACLFTLPWLGIAYAWRDKDSLGRHGFAKEILTSFSEGCGQSQEGRDRCDDQGAVAQDHQRLGRR